MNKEIELESLYKFLGVSFLSHLSINFSVLLIHRLHIPINYPQLGAILDNNYWSELV